MRWGLQVHTGALPCSFPADHKAVFFWRIICANKLFDLKKKSQSTDKNTMVKVVCQEQWNVASYSQQSWNQKSLILLKHTETENFSKTKKRQHTVTKIFVGKGIGDSRGRGDTNSHESRIDKSTGQDRSDSHIHWRATAGDSETTEGACS